MRRSLLGFLFVSVLMVLLPAAAGWGDRSLSPEVKRLSEQLKQTLIAAGKCKDVNDCTHQSIITFAIGDANLHVQVYGIDDYKTIAAMTADCILLAAELKSDKQLDIKFFEDTKPQDLERPFWRKAKVRGELTLNGGNNAKR